MNELWAPSGAERGRAVLGVPRGFQPSPAPYSASLPTATLASTLVHLNLLEDVHTRSFTNNCLPPLPNDFLFRIEIQTESRLVCLYYIVMNGEPRGF